jgi:hypothetical protein
LEKVLEIEHFNAPLASSRAAPASQQNQVVLLYRYSRA